MKKLLVIVAILLVAVLMVMTRPEKDAHKEAMMKAVKEFVDEEADERGFGDNVLTSLGKNIVNKTVETALNAKLKMDDYYLFNTTHVRLKGKDQLLSVGLLGQVITFDKKMLREKLEEAMQSKEEAANEKEAAKQSAKELKQLEKEQKKREKELEKERKRQEKEARKEQKRLEKEAKKRAKESKD
ncbi:MAG: DUF4359 domain-containing protein [Prevotella sp.]|nr:DUF4359 domain-containing protein [Prevotella sp.]